MKEGEKEWQLVLVFWLKCKETETIHFQLISTFCVKVLKNQYLLFNKMVTELSDAIYESASYSERPMRPVL